METPENQVEWPERKQQIPVGKHVRQLLDDCTPEEVVLIVKFVQAIRKDEMEKMLARAKRNGRIQ